jgi:hypothetical protein
MLRHRRGRVCLKCRQVAALYRSEVRPGMRHATHDTAGEQNHQSGKYCPRSRPISHSTSPSLLRAENHSWCAPLRLRIGGERSHSTHVTSNPEPASPSLTTCRCRTSEPSRLVYSVRPYNAPSVDSLKDKQASVLPAITKVGQRGGAANRIARGSHRRSLGPRESLVDPNGTFSRHRS